DLRSQRLQDPPELPPGEVEHAEVIERTAATEDLSGDRHPVAGPFQDPHGGFRDLRLEEVGERVRPEQDGRGPGPRNKPLSKRRARESRDLAIRMDAAEPLQDS